MKSNYGIDRVIEPVGMVPVSAWKIDNSPALRPREARVRLRRVHIDWDSFRQICSSCACDQSQCDSRNRGDFQCDRADDNDWRNQQQRIDVEGILQSVCQNFSL